MAHLNDRRWLIVLMTGLVLLGSTASADTWHLSRDGEWQNAEDSEQGRYALAVAEAKQNMAEGNAAAALQELRSEYPELGGPDFDMFMQGEKAYARGDLNNATKIFNKFLNEYPDSWLYPSALERKYAIATGFLHGEKRTVFRFIKLPAREEGANMMHEIADRTGDAPIARRSLVTLAESYQQRGKHLDEYETWAEISSRWPTGQMGRQAQFGMAYSLHSAYKGPRYDGASLVSSRTYYENIKSRYPNEATKEEVQQKIELVDEQMAYKEYTIGEYYERTDSPEAAKIYYRRVLQRWPGSRAAQLAGDKLAILEGEKEAPETKKSIRRKAFDMTNVFFDKWLAIPNKPLRKVLKD